MSWLIGLAVCAGAVLTARRAEMRLVGRLVAWYAAAAGCVGLGLHGTGGLLAGAGLLGVGQRLWLSMGLIALVGGFVGAVISRRLPLRELLLASLPLVGALALPLLLPADDLRLQLGDGYARALAVIPAIVALCGYFGASLGFLLWGSGRLQRRSYVEGLIGRRFLLSRASRLLSTVTAISMVGVTLGVWLVLVALGVLSGFEYDLQGKIIGANAHLVLANRRNLPFAYTAELQAALHQAQQSTASDMAALAPFVQGEVAIASASQYTGAMLFGVDPAQSRPVLKTLRALHSGDLALLQRDMQPVAPAARQADAHGFMPPALLRGLLVGRELARSLNVRVGDRVRLISPSREVLSPLGPAPQSLGFVVAGIFASNMYEYDARYIYAALPAARAFLGLGDNAISGVQVQCHSSERTQLAAQVLQRSAAQHGLADATVRDWRQRNQTLFAALALERIVAFVVLVFIILVASFSIVNTLTMAVVEKRREIAILKTMGARDVSILKIFLIQGLCVGGTGTLAGCGLGILSMALLQRFGFWIPGEVYYIDALPVRLEGVDVALVVLAALLMVWDFAVFPSLRGAALTPVEGLRDS